MLTSPVSIFTLEALFSKKLCKCRDNISWQEIAMRHSLQNLTFTLLKLFTGSWPHAGGGLTTKSPHL